MSPTSCQVTRAHVSRSSACGDSPVQCCLIAMPQGNTVKKLTADRKKATQGGLSLQKGFKTKKTFR